MDPPGVRGSRLSDAPPLLEARAALLRGDLPTLDRLLATDPELVHRRVTDTGPPYDGYFHGATLLHHVAANPRISDLPAGIVDVAGA